MMQALSSQLSGWVDRLAIWIVICLPTCPPVRLSYRVSISSPPPAMLLE